MQALIDTNVVLDVLLNRAPFADDSADVLRLSGEQIREFVSASAITDIYFIARKEIGNREQAKNLLKRLLQVVRVADLSEREIDAALDADWPDFEDAVQNAVAELHGFDAIVTRNPSDFAQSSLPVYSPKDFVGLNRPPQSP
jgi:predicted nucleic acid-binding protein